MTIDQLLGIHPDDFKKVLDFLNDFDGFKNRTPAQQYERMKNLPSPGRMRGHLDHEIGVANYPIEPIDSLNDPRFSQGYVPDDEQAQIYLKAQEANREKAFRIVQQDEAVGIVDAYRTQYLQALDFIAVQYPGNRSMQLLVEKLRPRLETEVMKGV